jgi:hypothetical protein
MGIERIWFDAPHLRWRRVVATAVIIFVPLLAWMAHERGVWPGEEITLAAIAPGSTSPSVTRIPRPGISTHLPALQPAALAASAPGRAEPGEVELCGVGTLQVSDEPKEADAQSRRIFKARSPAARTAWLNAMQASTDVRTRAAGWLLEALRPDALVADDPADEDERHKAECGGAKACIDQLDKQGVQQLEARSAGARDKLARLAHDSRDPLVYAYAMNLCTSSQWLTKSATAPGACQLLSDAQWVSVDPDNAHPWLVRADRASSGEMAEVLYRASRANSHKTYWGAAYSLVLAAEPAGTAAVDRILMLVDIRAMDAISPVALSAATKQCASPMLSDANRRETCDSLAELFVHRSQTWTERIFGEKMGERLGWSVERLERLREESDGLRHAQVAVFDEAAGTYSCQNMLTTTTFFADVARVGEIGAARELQRRSGKSMSELAQARRDRLKALTDVARQAKRPASASAS